MAPNHHQITHSFTFSILLLLFLTIPISCNPFPSFGYPDFRNGSNFETQMALYGDAKVDQNGSSVQLTTPNKFSSGRVMYKKAINLNVGDTKSSFGTYFSFSLSPENGDGLAFVMVPYGFSFDGTVLFGLSNELSKKKNRPFVIEFDTKLDPKYGDLNGNHVGVDVGSLVSVKVANVSKLNLVLSSGEKLQCWIDYDATSKRIEIRLNKHGKNRPVNPLLSYPLDLSVMFENTSSVLIGLTSSNSNSSQVCRLYSWRFKLRQVPHWMHSQPLDPQGYTKDVEAVRKIHKRSECIVRIGTALIFGTGCGALGAFIGLCVWTMFANKKPVAPQELVVGPIQCECDKFNSFVAGKIVKDGDFKCVA